MKITFISGPKGKAIPAQAVRSVYRRGQMPNGEGVLEKVDLADLFALPSELYINHYETCPHANEFRTARAKGSGTKSP
jgi:hypothetical protein